MLTETTEQNSNSIICTDPYHADAICHNGVFHADDVFATVLLTKVISSPLRLSRVSQVPDDLPANIIVFDIGGGKYDHHQKGGNGVREDGIPYASFGLLWKDYGQRLCQKLGLDKKYGMVEFDRFVSGIDGYDNGQFHPKDSPMLNLSNCIATFNPTWENSSPENFNQAFAHAVSFASIVFDNVMDGIISRFHARSVLQDALQKADSNILYLDRFVPVSAFPEIKEQIRAMVYPSPREGYNIQILDYKYQFPSSFLGLSRKELCNATGLSSILFIHNSGRLAGAETLDDIHRLSKMIELNPDFANG